MTLDTHDTHDTLMTNDTNDNQGVSFDGLRMSLRDMQNGLWNGLRLKYHLPLLS